MMLKLKLQYFGHLMRRVNSLEKTLMLGGIGGRRRRGRHRMRWLDGITDSMDVSLSDKSIILCLLKLGHKKHMASTWLSLSLCVSAQSQCCGWINANNKEGEDSFWELEQSRQDFKKEVNCLISYKKRHLFWGNKRKESV